MSSRSDGRGLRDENGAGVTSMRMALPDNMFVEADQSRLSAFRTWVLDQGVTESK